MQSSLIGLVIIAAVCFLTGTLTAYSHASKHSISHMEIKACAELRPTGNGNATGETIVRFNLIDGKMENVVLGKCDTE